MNVIKAVLAVGLVALLSGCGQPEFNRSDKGIVFVNGKPYAVPYGSKYGPASAKVYNGLMHVAAGLSKQNRQDLSDMIKATTCRPGEVRWTEPKAHAKILETLALEKAKKVEAFSGTREQYNAFRAGKAGCARPLNDKEYHYMLNQQNQRAANTRAQMYYDAATAPKYYNLHHTVYHY